MKPSYSTILQQSLLCLVVALVFSPAFRAEPCLLDDVAMLKGLQGTPQIDLKGLLSPHFAHASYYRPLLGVSFWFSQLLWQADPFAMHVENCVFHMVNVVLLFWLIRLALPGETGPKRHVPFLGALLFALHPLTAESVNWISGRTDLIAGGCLIGAAVAVVAWQRHGRSWWLLLLPLLVGGAIMTKEVAWGFLIVLPFLLPPHHDPRTHGLGLFSEQFSRLEKLLLVAGIALCFLLAALLRSFWPAIVLSVILGLIVLCRKPRSQPLSGKTWALVLGLLISSAALMPFLVKLARQSGANDIFSTFSRTLLISSLNVENSLALFSAAIAFYIKKFFLPLPLSFAITDIAPGYLFAGIAAVVLTAFLAAWRSPAALLFLTGIALLLPILPLVHGEIAWTPYAERYTYIPSAFWTASLAVGLGSFKRPSLASSCTALCLVLIPMAGLITYTRCRVWQTNVSLFEDTVRKSPSHLKARVLYMTALSEANRPAEALEQYRRMQKGPENRVPVKYVNDLAKTLNQSGLKREAWEVLETSLAKPLPEGRHHPMASDEWQRLYGLHAKIRQELFPEK